MANGFSGAEVIGRSGLRLDLLKGSGDTKYKQLFFLGGVGVLVCEKKELWSQLEDDVRCGDFKKYHY